MVVLSSERLTLRTLVENDADELTVLVARNKHYWSIYEPLHAAEYYTKEFQVKRIADSVRQLEMRREYSFGIFMEQRLIGHISLYSIKRLPFSSAFIGYSLDESLAGNGIATEAVNCVTKFAFESLAIHRIEAYVSPENLASVKVLEKSGYNQEGLLKQLLYINGKWVDHYLYALIAPEY